MGSGRLVSLGASEAFKGEGSRFLVSAQQATPLRRFLLTSPSRPPPPSPSDSPALNRESERECQGVLNRKPSRAGLPGAPQRRFPPCPVGGASLVCHSSLPPPSGAHATLSSQGPWSLMRVQPLRPRSPPVSKPGPCPGRGRALAGAAAELGSWGVGRSVRGTRAARGSRLRACPLPGGDRRLPSDGFCLLRKSRGCRSSWRRRRRRRGSRRARARSARRSWPRCGGGWRRRSGRGRPATPCAAPWPTRAASCAGPWPPRPTCASTWPGAWRRGRPPRGSRGLR